MNWLYLFDNNSSSDLRYYCSECYPMASHSDVDTHYNNNCRGKVSNLFINSSEVLNTLMNLSRKKGACLDNIPPLLLINAVHSLRKNVCN